MTSNKILEAVERAALAQAFTAALTGDADAMNGALATLDTHQRHRLVHAGQRLTRAARASLRPNPGPTGVTVTGLSADPAAPPGYAPCGNNSAHLAHAWGPPGAGQVCPGRRIPLGPQT